MSRDDSGQASVLAVGLVFLAVALVGLAWDATGLLSARRRAQAAADAAALAAATAVADTWVEEGGASAPVIDSVEGAGRAWESLEASDAPDADVDVTATSVSVRVMVAVPLSFVGFFGIDEMTVTAAATAGPRMSRP